MITKSKKAVGTVFYVPTITEEGQKFLGLLKKYVNRGEYRVSIRGRNEDRAGVARAMGIGPRAFHQDVPLENSTYVAVYVDGKTTTRIANTQLKALYERIDTERTRGSEAIALRNQLEMKLRAQEALVKLADKKMEQAQEIIQDHVNTMINPPMMMLPPSPGRVPSWSSVWNDFKTVLSKLMTTKVISLRSQHGN